MAPGPPIAGGMLFSGSGYAAVAEHLGNVLLVFATDENRMDLAGRRRWAITQIIYTTCTGTPE
jgi:hypothetical protein